MIQRNTRSISNFLDIDDRILLNVCEHCLIRMNLSSTTSIPIVVSDLMLGEKGTTNSIIMITVEGFRNCELYVHITFAHYIYIKSLTIFI